MVLRSIYVEFSRDMKTPPVSAVEISHSSPIAHDEMIEESYRSQLRLAPCQLLLLLQLLLFT